MLRKSARRFYYLDEDDAGRRLEETSQTEYRYARKGRYAGFPDEIRPGDLISVRGGFDYYEGGRRARYHARIYTRLAKGPAWGEAAETPPEWAVKAVERRLYYSRPLKQIQTSRRKERLAREAKAREIAEKQLSLPLT